MVMVSLARKRELTQAQAVLLIAIKLPVPALVQDMILLLVMLIMPVPPVFNIPDNAEAPVPGTVQF